MSSLLHLHVNMYKPTVHNTRKCGFESESKTRLPVTYDSETIVHNVWPMNRVRLLLVTWSKIKLLVCIVFLYAKRYQTTTEINNLMVRYHYLYVLSLLSNTFWTFFVSLWRTSLLVFWSHCDHIFTNLFLTLLVHIIEQLIV